MHPASIRQTTDPVRPPTAHHRYRRLLETSSRADVPRAGHARLPGEPALHRRRPGSERSWLGLPGGEGLGSYSSKDLNPLMAAVQRHFEAPKGDSVISLGAQIAMSPSR